MNDTLQWGGRFTSAPDPALIAFGSSLADDAVLAPFDVQVSLAHVVALRGGGIISAAIAGELTSALDRVVLEIADGSFATHAGAEFEDIHGAIDARVRVLAPSSGAWLHAGRSRNDQVATSLALYAASRAQSGAAAARAIAHDLLERAREALAADTVLAATTHGQPAQPVLFAFWLVAVAEPLARAVTRFSRAAGDAMRFCPLGSGALSGSSLPLDRAKAAAMLGFTAPSRNAMDAIGTRDAMLDTAHAFVRAATDLSRICAELIVWASPAYGYVRLGDRSSTGSSLMPQKRNPDVFELVRGGAAELAALYCGALSSLTGLAPSYYRDLQQTKRMTMQVCERGSALLDAFERAFADTSFDAAKMEERAALGFTTATDLADLLILGGSSARDAHAQVGDRIAQAEIDGTLVAGLPSAHASVRMKITAGSTAPSHVRDAIDALVAELDASA